MGLFDLPIIVLSGVFDSLDFWLTSQGPAVSLGREKEKKGRFKLGYDITGM